MLKPNEIKSWYEVRAEQGFDNKGNGDGMQASEEGMLNGTYGSMKGS